jgi:hypothetical protein
MMTTRISVIVLLLMIGAQSYGQRWKLMRYEAHGGIGFTNVMGDIGGTAQQDNMYGLKDIRIKGTGISIYLGGSYKFRSNMNVKASLFLGTASGSDVNSKNAVRNYSYKTRTIEPTVQYEYYFIKDVGRASNAIFGNRGMVSEYATFSMYAYIGAGGALAFPKLSTPSGIQQGVETTKSFMLAPVIPVGLGAKFGIDLYRYIGVEFGKRFLFGDYIDGLNTIYSKHSDTYYAGSVFFIYKIKNTRSGKPKLLWRKI